MITVDGQLLSDCVEVVESCCDQEAATGKPVHLLLRDLTSIDEAGRSLIRRLATKGVHLIARGVYTTYLVEASSPTGKKP